MKIYTQLEKPNLERDAVWVKVNGTKLEGVYLCDGEIWRPWQSAKTRITADFNPEPGVLVDYYVDGVHRLRHYEDGTFELAGGAAADVEEGEGEG